MRAIRTLATVSLTTYHCQIANTTATGHSFQGSKSLGSAGVAWLKRHEKKAVITKATSLHTSLLFACSNVKSSWAHNWDHESSDFLSTQATDLTRKSIDTERCRTGAVVPILLQLPVAFIGTVASQVRVTIFKNGCQDKKAD